MWAGRHHCVRIMFSLPFTQASGSGILRRSARAGFGTGRVPMPRLRGSRSRQAIDHCPSPRPWPISSELGDLSLPWVSCEGSSNQSRALACRRCCWSCGGSSILKGMSRRLCNSARRPPDFRKHFLDCRSLAVCELRELAFPRTFREFAVVLL